MSLCDIFVSSGHVTSTFLNPSDEAPALWGAFGTQFTCSAQGFIALLGTVSAPTYNLALCVYYLCVVKYSMRDEKFAKKIEPIFHAFAIIWSVGTAFYALLTKSINQGNGGACYINPFPIGCDKDESIECEGGQNAEEMRWIFHALPVLFIFISVNAVMGRLWYTVRQQEILMESYSFRLNFERRSQQEVRRGRCWYRPSSWQRNRQQETSSSHELDPVRITSDSNTNEELSSNNDSHRSSSIRFSNPQSNTSDTNINRHSSRSGRGAPGRRQQSSARRSQTREIHRQAMLYFLAFILTFGFIFLAEMMEGMYGDGKVPFAFYTLVDFFFPLQGVFNILVFMRPQVSKFRRRNPGYSYFRALFICLKNIDVNGNGGVRRGTTSLRPSARRSSRHVASVGRLNLERQTVRELFANIWGFLKKLKGQYSCTYTKAQAPVGRRTSMAVNFDVGRRTSMEGMDKISLFPDLETEEGNERSSLFLPDLETEEGNERSLFPNLETEESSERVTVEPLGKSL